MYRTRNTFSKQEWIKYYMFLLNNNIITIEQLKKKYEDYENHTEEWLHSFDRMSFINGQEAMLIIINDFELIEVD